MERQEGDLGIVLTQNVGTLSLAFFFRGLSPSFHFSGESAPTSLILHIRKRAEFLSVLHDATH